MIPTWIVAHGKLGLEAGLVGHIVSYFYGRRRGKALEGLFGLDELFGLVVDLALTRNRHAIKNTTEQGI